MTGASTATFDESDPYFIKGNLSINDEGKNTSVEKVLAEWRKDGTPGPIHRVQFAGVEAQTWTDVMGFVDISGRVRAYVFAGPNGHTYSASYLCAIGKFGERQDYVFGRILASLKFHEDRDLGGPARKKKG